MLKLQEGREVSEVKKEQKNLKVFCISGSHISYRISHISHPKSHITYPASKSLCPPCLWVSVFNQKLDGGKRKLFQEVRQKLQKGREVKEVKEVNEVKDVVSGSFCLSENLTNYESPLDKGVGGWMFEPNLEVSSTKWAKQKNRDLISHLSNLTSHIAYHTSHIQNLISHIPILRSIGITAAKRQLPLCNWVEG